MCFMISLNIIMAQLVSNSKIRINAQTVLSDFNVFLLFELYMPIIGSDAASLYVLLQNNLKNNINELEVEDVTVSLNKSITCLISAKKQLEAVGLVSTYFNVENGVKNLIIVLFSPKSPKKFFDDIILKGLLEKNIGKERLELKKKFFKLKSIDRTNYNEETAKLTDVFNIDFDSGDFKYDPTSNEVYVDFKSRKPKTLFNFDYFFNKLNEKYSLNSEDFSIEDKEVINSLANLYGYNEDFMIDLVYECFDNRTFKLDNKKLSKICFNSVAFNSVIKTPIKNTKSINNNSILATKIKYMEELSPYQYLKAKQNNVSPVRSDMTLISDLSYKLNLQNGVINALIDYVLERNNNILSRSLIEKIGATLLRNNIETALDAMNFLTGISSSERNKQLKEKTSNLDNEQATDLNELMDKFKEAFKE